MIEFFSPGPDDETFMELELSNGSRLSGRFSDQFTAGDDELQIRFFTYAYDTGTQGIYPIHCWYIAVKDIVAAARMNISQQAAERELAQRLKLQLFWKAEREEATRRGGKTKQEAATS